ncbi:MAG: hypothetical protein HY811_11525 [Planctomycetes bacterium]|nr:hypothetical protein [Planctomycetota bacterium]
MLNKTGVATALVITLVFLYAFAAGSLVCADEWSQTTFTEGTFNNTAPANNASDVVLSSSPLSSNWNALASTSATVNYGGALVYPGSGDYIYALCGDLTDNFWAYSISGNSWSAKTDTPVEVGWGGALVSTGGDYIYALRGNSTTDFWRYSISGNSWTDMSDTSDNVASGGALVYPGSGDYIYALRGGNTTDFWRYSISQNSWGAVESTPYNVNAGGSLVYAAGYIYALRGANFKTFWRYDIAQDSWSAKEDAPLAVNGGGAMAYPGSGDYIYAFKGYNSSWPVNNFWAYSISGNSWTTLTRTPSNLNSGGAMAFANGVLYALRGYSTDFWSDQCVNYASSGTFTSTAIEPANVYFWGILQFSATINSILTVDVLKSSDNSLLVHDVPSGTNLFQAYPSTFSGITGIKLRANLLTEDSSHTPILHDWRVGYSSYGTLPQARGAGSDGLAPRITDANATVDLSSGNVNIAVQITNIIPFNGLPTNVVIYYNSIAPADNPVTPLGANWTHTFNMRLITQTGGSIIQVTESGREILFWKDGESPAHWVSYPHYGLYRTIAIDSSTGNFVLTNKDRTTLTFLAANGKFYKAQDLNGHTVTAAYDASGDLDYVTLANGEQIDFTHSSHYMTNCSDPESNSTSFTVTYDRLDSATKSSPSWSYGWTYTGSAALMNVQTFPGSLDSRTYSFTSGKVTSITGPLSEAIGIAYYASPDYAVVTGRDDKVDTVYFNTQLDAWTRWIDEETSRGFDSYRNVITETKPSGATTYWSYDSRGNVLSTTNAALANTKYTYSDSTNPDLPTTILNALGITTTRTYNTAGQLTQEIEDAGASGLNRTSAWYYYSSTNTSYAAVIGQLYQYHRDPADLNLVTTYEYNSKGYGTKETVSKTSTGFSLVTGERVTNDIGWITTSYNVDYPSYIANNVATVYTYDNRGNRLTETDPYSVVTTNQYDLLDRVLTRTVDSAVGGLNLVTAWTYNWGGVTSQTTDPSGLAISSSTVYDAAGKVISRTDPAGATTEYYYYTNARLWKTKRQLTSAPSYAETIYYYDSNGNQTGILDSGGHAISMTYDSIDRLITTTDVASGNTTGSVYDLLDRQTATIDARGYATVTAYDNLNQVKYVRTAQSNITVAYAYDAVGRRNQVIGPWYDTDGDGVADAGEYVNPGNTISAPTAYTEYDPADRVTRTYINNTSTTDAKYYYDAMGDRSIHYVETLVDSATSSYQMVSSQYNKNKQVYLTALDPMGTLNEQTYFYFDK